MKMSFMKFFWLSVLLFSHLEMLFFTNIWLQIFFLFIKYRASSATRYSIVVFSIVWNIPQKHQLNPAEVLPNDSEALLLFCDTYKRYPLCPEKSKERPFINMGFAKWSCIISYSVEITCPTVERDIGAFSHKHGIHKVIFQLRLIQYGVEDYNFYTPFFGPNMTPY